MLDIEITGEAEITKIMLELEMTGETEITLRLC